MSEALGTLAMLAVYAASIVTSCVAYGVARDLVVRKQGQRGGQS